jgi:hypothetical protein
MAIAFFVPVLTVTWLVALPVDENMKRAQKKDAVLNQKFYWRWVVPLSFPPF